MKPKTIIRLCNIGIIICIIILIQIPFSVFQQLRYEKGVYDCSDMSIDCAKFFNFIGIKTRYVHGWYYDNTSDCGKSFHVWLELDFGLFKLPFESTFLLFLSPTIIRDYNEIKITDYYYNKLTDIWGDDIFIK